MIPTTTVQNVPNDDDEATNLTRTVDETTEKALKTRYSNLQFTIFNLFKPKNEDAKNDNEEAPVAPVAAPAAEKAPAVPNAHLQVPVLECIE